MNDTILPHQQLLNGNGLEKINNELFLDLIDVAASIFIQDVSIKTNSNDEARNLRLIVPVTDIETWNKQKRLLDSIANFLSGDRWDINFEKCNSKLYGLNIQQSFSNDFNFNNVTLLSGGLDSFCGAYTNIKNNMNSIYCGYKINNFETKSLSTIHDLLKNKYGALTYMFKKLDVNKNERTQRTRSFLFFALACATASMYNIKEIFLYENGVLSLNPELDSRRTTKTTHPKTLYLINKLLKRLGLDVCIKHPFLFKTKGQMINELSDEFKKNISLTNTCGMARHNTKITIKTEHCGFCIPCMLRKISMSAYDNEEYDVKYNAPYNTTLANCDPKFKSDFKSANEYFRTFNEKIKNGTIFNFINISKKYYDNKDYLELTKKMLDDFGREIDKFYSKYPYIEG